MYDPQSTQNYGGNVNKLLHSINCRYIGNGIGLPVRNLNNCKDMLNMFCVVSKLYCYTAVKKGGVPFQKSFFFFFFELLLPLCNAVSELWRWIMVSISWCHRGVDLWPFGYKMASLYHFILSDICSKCCYKCHINCWVMAKNVFCEVSVTFDPQNLELVLESKWNAVRRHKNDYLSSKILISISA